MASAQSASMLLMLHATFIWQWFMTLPFNKPHTVDKWLASVSRNVQLYGRSLISPYTAARAPVALVLGGDAPVGSGDRETPRGLNEQLIEASSVAPMGASIPGTATVTHA